MAKKKAPVQPRGVYRNAITEQDGVSVNVGYLCLFWLMGLDIAMSLMVMVAGAVMQVFNSVHTFPLEGVGIALGAIWGTFSTALGALGVFMAGEARKEAAQAA